MNEDGLTVGEALSNLYRLTDCRCYAGWVTRSKRHEPDCVSDYRADVERVAAALPDS